MPHDPLASPRELNKWFAKCQKDQFSQYVTKEKTFQQFRASVVSRQLNMPVMCLDDIRPGLEALIPNALDPCSETSKLLKRAHEDLEYQGDPTEQ